MVRCLCLSLVVVLALPVSSAAVQVTTLGGNKVDIFSRGELLDVVALLQAAGAKVGFSAASGSYVASREANEVHFTPGGSLAVINGELASLPGPVRTLEGRVVATVETASALLKPLGLRLLSGPGGLTLLPLGAVPVVEASLRTSGDSATLLLSGFEERPQVRVEVDGVRLVFAEAVQLASTPRSDGVLAGVQVQERELRFLLAAGWQVTGSEFADNPLRLTVNLVRQAPATPRAATRTQPLVVLDPGHGGDDEGAKGPSGVLEKNLTLTLSRRVAGYLQRAGVAVRLTREGDEALGLADRVAVANRLQADCFVSIHVNAATARGARGAETYFMSAEPSDSEAAQAAARENAPAGPVQLILWELAHVANLEASSRLALELQTRLNQLSGIRDRGVKQAPFAVLTGATMPAVLVEVGFLSNPEEEVRLSSPAEQERLAATLAEGILAFLRNRPSPPPNP
ncbi:MAG: N-acetylmuramoyl-L-alanine amidase [Thermoanaerobaculum sp.]|nr:N-acetylmuramoyl-L-alanine amidase [Thermoanaerobaculum sp.]